MTSNYLTIKGVKIHYLIEGQGPPLLFLHGHRSDALRFENFFLKLGKKYKIYAPDLPGFGRSDNLPVYHGMENYVPYLLGFIEELGLKDFFLVGTSLGAVFANLITQKIAGKIKKIVFLGPIFDKTSFKIPKIKYYLIVFLLTFFPRVPLLARIIDKLIRSDRFFRWFLPLFGSEYKKPEILDHEVRLWRVMSIKVWAESLKSLLSFKFPEEKNKVNIPTTLIFSEKDQYLNLQKTIKSFSEIFSNQKVVIVPGLNHIPKGEISQIFVIPEVEQLFNDV